MRAGVGDTLLFDVCMLFQSTSAYCFDKGRVLVCITFMMSSKTVPSVVIWDMVPIICTVYLIQERVTRVRV